jgi:hypothetical protein
MKGVSLRNSLLKRVAFALGTLGLAAFLIAGNLLAAEPTLTHLHPVSGQQGTTVSVTASGKAEPWPPGVWVSGAGVTFKSGNKAGSYSVEISPDASPGPRLVRFFNDDGASAPRFFIVNRDPELLEVEPNDSFTAPQKISALPVTVAGRLDKSGDVDSFAVELKAGRTLVARVEGHLLGSTFDGMLRLVDGNGVQLAFNHDGRTLDPLLAWEVPHDGTYIVQVMGFVHPASSEVRFTGGEGCVYRLHLTDGAFVRHTVPLAVQRGKTTPIRFAGYNLAAKGAEIDCSQIAVKQTELSLDGIAFEQPVPVSDVAETVEQDVSATQAIELPGAVTGRINPAGDEDRFTFTATSKTVYAIQLTAARAGSPLDGWIKIEDSAGKELARNDDAGSADPNLTWTAPSDGVFSVVVGEVTQRGGDDFIYRVAIETAKPSITAMTTSHALKLTPGKEGEVKVAVKRENGFASKMKLVAMDLPQGVSAAEVDVPEKDGEVTLKLTADATAPAANQPFRMILRELETGVEHAVSYSLASTSEDNGVPQGFAELVINSTEQLWLTVTPPPKPPEPKAAEPPAT